MSITINTVFRKDKINKSNQAPINLRLVHKGKIRYISTGITLPLEAWDAEKQQIVGEYPNALELQMQILAKRLEYEKKVKRLEALDIEVTFDALFGVKSKRINCTVEEYFNQHIERLKSIGKISASVKYHCCLVALRKCGKVNIHFDEVDMQYLRDFETSLIIKGNVSNTIATHLSVFKALYNRAIEDGIFEPRVNPFVKFKVGKYWKPTRKRAITKEEILKLKAIELPETDGSFYLRFARDIFLFSYYMAGINFKDIATLRWSNIQNERVYYQRHKTSKELSCRLLPEAKQIIETYGSPFYEDEDYIFPILDRNIHKTEQQIFNRVHKVLINVNNNLKRLSDMAGFRIPITTYVARHTFATVLKRSGVNIALISESLGHSDLSTTQIYLDSFENSQIDEAMGNLL